MSIVEVLVRVFIAGGSLLIALGGMIFRGGTKTARDMLWLGIFFLGGGLTILALTAG